MLTVNCGLGKQAENLPSNHDTWTCRAAVCNQCTINCKDDDDGDDDNTMISNQEWFPIPMLIMLYVGSLV